VLLEKLVVFNKKTENCFSSYEGHVRTLLPLFCFLNEGKGTLSNPAMMSRWLYY